MADNTIEKRMNTSKFNLFWERLQNHNWMWLLETNVLDHRAGKEAEDRLSTFAGREGSPFREAIEFWKEKRNANTSGKRLQKYELHDFIDHLNEVANASVEETVAEVSESVVEVTAEELKAVDEAVDKLALDAYIEPSLAGLITPKKERAAKTANVIKLPPSNIKRPSFKR